MARLIDADEFTQQIACYAIKDGFNVEKVATLWMLIDTLPTVDAAPIRHGRWIDEDNGLYSCSICDILEHRTARPNYCPDCGAKMDAKEDADDG